MWGKSLLRELCTKSQLPAVLQCASFPWSRNEVPALSSRAEPETLPGPESDPCCTRRFCALPTPPAASVTLSTTSYPKKQ